MTAAAIAAAKTAPPSGLLAAQITLNGCSPAANAVMPVARPIIQGTAMKAIAKPNTSARRTDGPAA